MQSLFRKIIPLYFVLLLLLASAGLASSPKESKRVLLLYSEDKAHPAHGLTDGGIRAVFRSNKLFDVLVYSEYLDLSRFSRKPAAIKMVSPSKKVPTTKATYP
jgi:hypothetical protein